MARPRYKWSREKIVQDLLRRSAKGLALNIGAIQKSQLPLSQAIYNHFGSHDAALSAAGIDPASVRKASFWDKTRILNELRARRDAAKGLSNSEVEREDPPLYGAINRFFVSFSAALRAAGIDPKSVRLSVVYENKADVIAALHERHASGRAMNPGDLRSDRPGLHDAACRYFRSYKDALRAAGIDLTWRTFQNWDRSSVVQALRARQARRLAVNSRAISNSDKKLFNAIRHYFPSHDAALGAAGIDPASVRKAGHWDQARIVSALQARRGQDLPMNFAAIALSDPRLASAISRYFGSHDRALRAVGIDPDSVKKRRLMDKPAILAALRDAACEGSISHHMLKTTNARLLSAAHRRFGSLRAAVLAAGLTYIGRYRETGSRDGHWTDQLVLQTLRDLHRDGHDLRYRTMKTRSQSLFFAAKDRFGSYVNAIRQAGIDYWQMSQHHLAKDRAAAAATGRGDEGSE